MKQAGVKKFKGMTLVETLVAMFIFSLGIAGFTMLFSKSWKVNASIIEEGNTTRAASNAIAEIVRDLRKVKQADDGSYPIQSVGSFDLTVFIKDNDNPDITDRVHYFLDNNQNLKKGITKPVSGVYQAGDQTVTTIASYITNTASDPIFYYYNNDYPLDTTNNPLSNPQPVNVRLIQIHLWVNIKPNIAPDNVNVQSFVELRNINENY